jgi:general secretion pathway protein G
MSRFVHPSLERGFTLIELLVVIAIIGILSSVVLASLNTARMKSRDTRRIADVKQIQLALELFFDSCSRYPVNAYAAENGCTGGIAPTYIATVPKDPSGSNYLYAGLNTAGGATVCESYHLGAILEDNTNPALQSDRDTSGGAQCTGATQFDGTSAACTTTAGTPQPGGSELCYDLGP